MSGRRVVWWLMLLLLGSSAIAWIASMALVLAVPRPKDLGPTVRDVVRALQGELAPGKYRFERTEEEETPFPSLRSGGSQDMIPHALAATIRRQLGGNREVRLQLAPFTITSSSPGLPQIDEAIEKDLLGLPGSSFAVRNLDGRWTVIRPAEPLISRWHLQIFGGFFLFASILLPVAYLAARRMSGPIRELAEWALEGRLEQDPPSLVAAPLELQQMSAALRELRQRLGRHLEERTVMLAAVAHDLRSPLTALRLRSESASPAAQGKMAADIERMERMIGQFLQFVEGSGSRDAVKAVDLRALVETVVCEAVDAGLPVSHPPLPPLSVQGDPLDLQRMLRNLIDNSVRFGGRAEVSLAGEAEWALLRVSDEGPGLPPAELQRVFQPFYRPDCARNAATGGAGLGLAIVRTIARAHGGDALLRNRISGGVDAEVRLPWQPATEQKPREAAVT